MKGDTFSAQNWLYGKAPRRLVLEGDRHKKAEAAQHIIEFPGGAIELTRTTDGSAYWAHIVINCGPHAFGEGDAGGRTSALGEVVGGRIDSAAGVLSIPNAETMTQIAVLIRPRSS